MRLSTRARYGSRAMLDLAIHYGERLVPIKQVSERQEISVRYLEGLMAPLRAVGLVRTERGNRGGYCLGRDPSEIALGEIIRVLEGSLAPVPCVDDHRFCHRALHCVTRTLWCRLQLAMTDILDETTLADMVEMQKELESE